MNNQKGLWGIDSNSSLIIFYTLHYSESLGVSFYVVVYVRRQHGNIKKEFTNRSCYKKRVNSFTSFPLLLGVSKDTLPSTKRGCDPYVLRRYFECLSDVLQILGLTIPALLHFYQPLHSRPHRRYSEGAGNESGGQGTERER